MDLENAGGLSCSDMIHFFETLHVPQKILVYIASSELVSKSYVLVIALVLALIQCECANCSFSDLKRPHLLSVEDPQVIIGFIKLFFVMLLVFGYVSIKANMLCTS